MRVTLQDNILFYSLPAMVGSTVALLAFWLGWLTLIQGSTLIGLLIVVVK